MIITNNYGLSSRTYNAIVHSMNEYDAGDSDYSITSLYNPPRIVHLTKRHWDEIVVDARDLIWAFWGNLGHLALARYAEGLSEERLFVTILGRRISGQTDHYHQGVITDYKFVKTKALKYLNKKNDWPFQLNSYAHLFRQHGHEVTSLRIEAFLKDWEERQVGISRGYPPSPVATIHYPIWAEEVIAQALHDRVEQMVINEQVSDGNLPECTGEERWEQPTLYALMKEGAKKATLLTPNARQANAAKQRHEAKAGKPYFIERRPGTRLRCEKYCVVREFCNVYQMYKHEVNGNTT